MERGKSWSGRAGAQATQIAAALPAGLDPAATLTVHGPASSSRPCSQRRLSTASGRIPIPWGDSRAATPHHGAPRSEAAGKQHQLTHEPNKRALAVYAAAGY
ncbi:MAG: hypothetical protein ABJB98_09305 [Actinomycetota bacterium]